MIAETAHENIKTVEPPEDDFFSGDTRSKAEREKTMKLRFKQVGLSLLAVGITLFLLFAMTGKGSHGTHGKTNSAGQLDPKPQLISQLAMETAIQNSQAKEDVALPSVVNPSQGAKKPRSFKSELAAYVYQEKEKDQNDHFREVSQPAKLGIPTGTKVPALLEDRVFSFNVAAPVLAYVTQDFLISGKVMIPKGAKFLGEASILKSIDRINVSFDLIIFPDGSEKRIHGLALSQDGSSGIRGHVDKHRDLKVLKAIGETLLGGASLFVGGVNRDAYSLEDSMRSNFAQNMTGQAGQDLRSVRTDESISVEASTPIQIMLLEAL